MAEVRYAVIGSGSTANSYIFEYGDFSFVVDNGYSLKEFSRRCGELDFSLDKIKFILLTHSHSDHIKGVPELSKLLKIPVIHHADHKPVHPQKKRFYSLLPLKAKKKYHMDEVKTILFETSHDSPGSAGYCFHLGGKTFTLITDTGMISKEMFRYAFHSNILFLEANYSREMLINGPYPPFLKQRILSDKGHLSNHMAGELMKELEIRKRSAVQGIYLCHLSDKNNTPQKAGEEIGEFFKGGIPHRICPKNEMIPGKW